MGSEGAFKAIQSNCLLNAGMKIKADLTNGYLIFSWILPAFTWQSHWFHCHTALAVRKFFPDIQPKSGSGPGNQIIEETKYSTPGSSPQAGADPSSRKCLFCFYPWCSELEEQVSQPASGDWSILHRISQDLKKVYIQDSCRRWWQASSLMSSSLCQRLDDAMLILAGHVSLRKTIEARASREKDILLVQERQFSLGRACLPSCSQNSRQVHRI